MSGKGYKQGRSRGEIEARVSWKAFKSSAIPDVLGLDPSVQEEVLETERPARRHLTDKEWRDFKRGFNDGHTSELKRLTRAIAPASVVRNAPLVCALLDAVNAARELDQRTVEPSPRRLHERFRVAMAGAGSGNRGAAALGRAAGLEDADLAWKTFEATGTVDGLRLTRASLTEWAYDVSIERQQGAPNQAHVEFAAAFAGAYSSVLERHINRLVPKRSRDWGWHLVALFRALGLDQPQMTGMPETATEAVQ